MKKITYFLPLTLISLIFTNSSWAKDIRIQFANGSYCGSYGGRVSVGDNFVLNLAPEQQLIIKNRRGHDYSVIAPNGNFLEIVQRWSPEEVQYWTGNQSGNFKVRINSVPSGMQANMEFCAYTGEGNL